MKEQSIKELFQEHLKHQIVGRIDTNDMFEKPIFITYYIAWFVQQMTTQKRPSKALWKSTLAQVSAKDETKHFSDDIEMNLLQRLRQRKAWTCLKGTKTRVGRAGLKQNATSKNKLIGRKRMHIQEFPPRNSEEFFDNLQIGEKYLKDDIGTFSDSRWLSAVRPPKNRRLIDSTVILTKPYIKDYVGVGENSYRSHAAREPEPDDYKEEDFKLPLPIKACEKAFDPLTPNVLCSYAREYSMDDLVASLFSWDDRVMSIKQRDRKK